MYTSLTLVRKYFSYYSSAFNAKGHGMHSPFVFNFILDVLQNNKLYVPPPAIELLRQDLRQSRKILNLQDLGAGSRTKGAATRTVGQLARRAVKPKKYSQVLFRLIKKYQPATILELGTSLGLTTAYLASAAPASRVISIEGSEAVHQIAQQNMLQLNITNVELLLGNFDDVLPCLLRNWHKVDVAFIDGNHRYAPTMAYFHLFLEKIGNNSILIFDDIHWSAEMEQAWREICQHPAVRCTVDIFFLGFVFFRSEFHQPQHFTVRY